MPLDPSTMGALRRYNFSSRVRTPSRYIPGYLQFSQKILKSPERWFMSRSFFRRLHISRTPSLLLLQKTNVSFIYLSLGLRLWLRTLRPF